jgi:DNA polymerase
VNLYDDINVVKWRLRPGRKALCEPSQANVAAVSGHEAPGIDEPNSQTEQIEPSSDPIQGLNWQSMQSAIEHGEFCPSCTRSNSILGDGDPQSDWFFVVDAPTTGDVQNGTLLSGRSGQLFEAMLQALRLQRSQVYLTSVFKCAAIDDLSISPQCNTLLHRQLELAEPKVVVAFGEFAAQSVARANESLEQLRSESHHCYTTQVAIVPTYSPAQMLDEPALKAEVWRDLQRCLAVLA